MKWGIFLDVYFIIAGLCMLAFLILLLIKVPNNLLFGDTYSGIFWWSLFWFICIPFAIYGYLSHRSYSKTREAIAYAVFLDITYYNQTKLPFDYMVVKQIHPEINSIKEYENIVYLEGKDIWSELVRANSCQDIYNVLTKYGIGKELKKKTKS